MTYKTIIIDYAPKAKKMAAAIEETANERALDGWELVTFSVTNSAKAILVFRRMLSRMQSLMRKLRSRLKPPKPTVTLNEAGHHRHRLKLHSPDAL